MKPITLIFGFNIWKLSMKSHAAVRDMRCTLYKMQGKLCVCEAYTLEENLMKSWH